MTEDDPERLIAEALRAHASRTSLPATPRAEPTFGGFDLLSGSAAELPLRREDPTLHDPSAETGRIETASRPVFGWVILLAVLLGFAAGAVIGLVTLL